MSTENLRNARLSHVTHATHAPRPHGFAVLAAIVAVAGFFGGALSGRIFAPREALAQSRPLTTTINVGEQGLVFRGSDGRVIARLSEDPIQGGIFELYNASGQPGARLRASALTGTLDVYPSSAPMGSPALAPLPPPVSPGSALARDMGF